MLSLSSHRSLGPVYRLGDCWRIFFLFSHGVLSTVEKLKPLVDQYSSDLIIPAWVSQSIALPSSTATENPQIVDETKESSTCSA